MGPGIVGRVVLPPFVRSAPHGYQVVFHPFARALAPYAGNAQSDSSYATKGWAMYEYGIESFASSCLALGSAASATCVSIARW